VIARVLRSTAFRVLVTAAILFYLFRKIDLAASGSAMLRVDPWWFAFTLALVALDRLIMAWRWLILLRAAGVDLPAWTAVRIFLTSSFVGSLVPAGIGADLARAYAATSQTAQGSQAVASVGIDRILGVVACVGLGAIGAAGWSRHLDPAFHNYLLVVSTAAGVGALALLWVDVLVTRWLPERWRERRWGWRIYRLGEAVGAYRRRPAVLSGVLLLSVLVQILRVFQGYGLGRGLAVNVPLAFYLVFMPLVLLLLLLPVSISGFGLPQAAIVWLLGPLGVPEAQSFAMSTLFILIGLFGNLPGAFLYLGRKKPLT
jgi:glycosyltransferase 2 family protein